MAGRCECDQRLADARRRLGIDISSLIGCVRAALRLRVEGQVFKSIFDAFCSCIASVFVVPYARRKHLHTHVSDRCVAYSRVLTQTSPAVVDNRGAPVPCSPRFSRASGRRCACSASKTSCVESPRPASLPRLSGAPRTDCRRQKGSLHIIQKARLFKGRRRHLRDIRPERWCA